MTNAKTQLTEAVLQALAKLSSYKGVSNNLSDLVMNFRLLLLYVSHFDFEEIQEWISVYDMQSHMFVRGYLVACTVHPNTLPIEEEMYFKEEIKILQDFVEFTRSNINSFKVD